MKNQEILYAIYNGDNLVFSDEDYPSPLIYQEEEDAQICLYFPGEKVRLVKLIVIGDNDV